MRRIIRGVLAAVVLIFCFCAVGMTGRDSGTTESREEGNRSRNSPGEPEGGRGNNGYGKRVLQYGDHG